VAVRKVSSREVADSSRSIHLTISAALKRAGMEMKFVIPGAKETMTPDASLVGLLIRAHALARRLAMSPGSTLESVGAQEGISASYAARLLRLNTLAPGIVGAILNGRQPVGLTAKKLMADTRWPLEWSKQRTALGLA
jgi:site-specific DNA recombinase